MLGKDIIGFKRQQFVKDLYDPKLFLNNFNDVHFNSVSTLVKCMKNDYYIPRDILRVNVRSEEEFQAIKRLILESSLTDIARVFLCLNYGHDLSVYGKMAHKSFSIVTTPTVYINNMQDKEFLKFRAANATFVEQCVRANNFRNVFDDMKDIHFRNITRLFLIKFDYISLSTLSQEELHELQFHINHFLNWTMVSQEKGASGKKGRHGIEWYRTGDRFMKPIYIDESLNLWFNEWHFFDKKTTDTKPLFQLQPDKTGEDIQFRELNMIRQYIDLPVEGLVMKDKRRLSFVDYYQNTLLMNTFNEVPLITELISEWFVL